MSSYNVENYRHEQLRKVASERPIYAAPVRTVASESLFQGDREIGIDHGGAVYRLKITRQGKLILNK